MTLGCYALYCIGLGLFNFGDPGSAAEDLVEVGGVWARGRAVAQGRREVVSGSAVGTRVLLPHPPSRRTLRRPRLG